MNATKKLPETELKASLKKQFDDIKQKSKERKYNRTVNKLKEQLKNPTGITNNLMNMT